MICNISSNRRLIDYLFYFSVIYDAANIGEFVFRSFYIPILFYIIFCIKSL